MRFPAACLNCCVAQVMEYLKYLVVKAVFCVRHALCQCLQPAFGPSQHVARAVQITAYQAILVFIDDTSSQNNKAALPHLDIKHAVPMWPTGRVDIVL